MTEKYQRNPVLEANLDALKRNFPQIYQKVINYTPSPIGQIISSKNGLPNILFHFKEGPPMIAYNPHDPLIDANLFLKSIDENEKILVIFIGLGLGYGPLQVLRERPKLVRIVIVEPWMDMFIHALHLIDLTPLLNSPRLLLYIGEFDDQEFERDLQRTAAILSTRILEFPLGQRVRKDLYKKVGDKVFEIANKINAHGATTMNCGEDFFHNRLESLTLLRHSYSYDILKDSFKDIPAILVAAGPSLDNDLELLKTLKNKALIIAADSALAPLLNAGIIPEMVTTLDFQKVNFEKLSPFVSPEQEWDFMLVAMLKGTPLLQKRFPAKYLVLGFMTDLPHLWMANCLEVKYYAPPAFSVAHVSMGVALISGANPIIFLGQDLGFTSSEDDHAKGTVFSQKFTERPDFLTVKGLDGEEIKTDRNLLGIKTLFEDIIRANPKKLFINATSKGAYIEGAMRLRLDEIKSLYLKDEIDIRHHLNELMKDSHTFNPTKLIDEMEKRIELSRNGIRKIDKLNEMQDEVKRELKKIIEKRPNIRSLEELDLGLKNKIHKITNINIEIDNLIEVNEPIIELHFKYLGENEIHKIQSEELKIQKGVLFWLQSELERFKSIQDSRRIYYQIFSKKTSLIKDFLKKEGILLEKIKNYSDKTSEFEQRAILLELAKLCIEYDMPVVALKYLKQLDNTSVNENDPEYLFLLGCIYSQMLAIDKAMEYFNEAVKLNDKLVDKINNFIEKEILLWTEIAQSRYYNDKILSLMISRISNLLKWNYFPKLPPNTIKLWQFFRDKYTNELIEKPEELQKKLSLWEPLKPFLENV